MTPRSNLYKVIQRVVEDTSKKINASGADAAASKSPLFELSPQITTEKFLEIQDLGLQPRRLALHTENKASFVFTIPLTLLGDRLGLWSEVPAKNFIVQNVSAPTGAGAVWTVLSFVGKGVLRSVNLALDLTSPNDAADATLALSIDEVTVFTALLSDIFTNDSPLIGDLFNVTRYHSWLKVLAFNFTPMMKFSRSCVLTITPIAGDNLEATSGAFISAELHNIRT